MKIQFIINASSGDGKGKNLLPLLQKKSGDLGLPAEFALSFHPQEAREIAFDGQRRGAELIVACGGDGTIHSILPALVHQPAALGIIPTGTANDLARNWNIPLNFDRALKVIAQGRPKSVDVIQVPGRGYIAGAAGIGFDAAVVEQAARLRRIYRGLLPFSIAFLSEFSRHTPAAVSLRAGDWRYQGPAWQILITKITRYAYILKITSPVSPDNGLMEICLIPETPRLGLLKTLPKLPFLGLRKLPGAILCTASQLEIESSPPMMIQGDGDLIGQTPAVFQVVPRALQIMTPPPRRRIRGLKSI